MRVIGCLIAVMASVCVLSVIKAEGSSDEKASVMDPIVIVGSGLTGHSAAAAILEAMETDESQRQWPKIIVLEKEAKFGGNSMKATSGINGALSSFQKDNEIEDSLPDFQEDTMYSSTNERKKELIDTVQVLTEQSGDAVNWLRTRFTLDLSSITQCGGHSHPRTHRPPRGPAGFLIVKSVHNYLEQEQYQDKIEFRYNQRVTELVTDDETQAVIGVRIESTPMGDSERSDKFGGLVEIVKSSAVLLASGGFGNDHSIEGSLLEEFGTKDGQESSFPTTNGAWATGDGVKLGRAIGARLVDMSYIQIHPTGFIDPSEPDSMSKFLAPEALRGSGGLLFNAQGLRFVNELDLRNRVVSAERAQKGGDLRLVLNQEMADLFGPNMGFYLKKGLFKKYDNWESLSIESGMNIDNLKSTIEEYNAVLLLLSSQKDSASLIEDRFGKRVFSVQNMIMMDEVVYSAIITPVIHYTMGGLQMNVDAQILGNNGDVIPGLFGAGEVTGGVHGRNRLAGNSLLECVVFGRIAGQNALKYAQSNQEFSVNESEHDEL